MNDLRIISFLPAATEMACALGLEPQLVGISHECDYPPVVQGKPVVLRCALRVDSMSPREIDFAVSESARSGRSLYEMDQQTLERLAPTHILIQTLCQVCAPSDNEIAGVLRALPSQPEILTFTPHCLHDIEDDLRKLGRIAGRLCNAERLIASHRARLQKVGSLNGGARHRPRVLCLEWIDPYYCCGHWVPEMIEIAGGEDCLGRKGSDSVRIAWNEISESSPEVLIVSPCGFTLEKAVKQTETLLQQPGWEGVPAVRDGRVFALNANAYFARPGPRIVDGIELLGHIFHPEWCNWNGPSDAFQRVAFTPQCSASEYP